MDPQEGLPLFFPSFPSLLSQSSYFWPLGMVVPSRDFVCCSNTSLGKRSGDPSHITCPYSPKCVEGVFLGSSHRQATPKQPQKQSIWGCAQHRMVAMVMILAKDIEEETLVES